MHTLFVYYEGIKLEDVLSSISLKLVYANFQLGCMSGAKFGGPNPLG